MLRQLIEFMNDVEKMTNLDGKGKCEYVIKRLEFVTRDTIPDSDWIVLKQYLPGIIDTLILMSKSEVVLNVNQHLKKCKNSCLLL